MESYPFSILIPTYNRRALLEETLNSIFREDASKNIEVVVVDDGSLDDIWNYLCTQKEKFETLKIYRHEENLGVSAARNTALKLATGNYIFFLDSDDFLVKGALDIILEKLNSKKEVYLVSVHIKKGEKKKTKIFPNLPEDPLLRLKYFIDGKYADGIYIFKKSLFDNFSFNPLLKVREDWVLEGKILALGSIEVIKEPLVVKRDHPLRLRNISEFYEDSIIVSVENLFESLPPSFQILYPYAIAKAYMELGKKFMRVKNYKKGYHYFQKAKISYPGLTKNFKFLKNWLKITLLKNFF